eukprot:4102032-Amphidinium_carterae.1
MALASAHTQLSTKQKHERQEQSTPMSDTSLHPPSSTLVLCRSLSRNARCVRVLLCNGARILQTPHQGRSRSGRQKTNDKASRQE